MISDILPNPFNKDSTLVGLQKKGLLLKQAAIIPSFIRNIVFLLITAYFLIVSLSFEVLPVLLVIGYEILLSFTYVLFSLRVYKSINALQTPENNSGLYSWSLTLKVAYYEAIKNAIKLIGSIGMILLIRLVFHGLDKTPINIPKFTIPALANTDNKINALNIIYLWVLLHLIGFFTTYLKYQLMKKIKMTDSFAENEKLYLLWKTKLEFITSIPLFSIFIFGIILLGVPVIVISPFIFIYLLIFYAMLRQLRGFQSFSYNQNSQPIGEPEVVSWMKPILEHSKEDRNSNADRNVIQNEEIKTIIYGVLRVAADLKSFFRVTGGGSYGVGSTIDRENSMVITNHRFLLTEIPVTGGNTIVGDLSYTQQNIFFNRKEIREKGEIYFRSVQLSQLINDSVRNYLFTDIKKVTVDNCNVTLEFLNGDKYKCTYFDKEYRAALRETLTQCLAEKTIFK